MLNHLHILPGVYTQLWKEWLAIPCDVGNTVRSLPERKDHSHLAHLKWKNVFVAAVTICVSRSSKDCSMATIRHNTDNL